MAARYLLGPGKQNVHTDKIKYLRSTGVSVVHIWLNDNTVDPGKPHNCKAFIYKDSALEQTFGTEATLRAFTVALQNATPPLKPIYTFSPLEQTEDYIKSLSAPGQPLKIGHADRAGPLRDYCTGLMMPCERKSVEPMAAVKYRDSPAIKSEEIAMMMPALAPTNFLKRLDRVSILRTV